MNRIIEIPADRVEEAGEVLASAFRDDPFCLWVLPVESDRPAQLEEMFTLTCRSRTALGQHLLGMEADGRLQAVICASGPEKLEWPGDLERAWDDFLHRLGSPGRERFEEYIEWTRKHSPRGPHLHVNALGVAPAAQRRGYGRQLLDEVIGLSSTHPLSTGVGLDTATPRNVSFYQNAGFHVTAEARKDLGRMWTLFRPDRPE